MSRLFGARCRAGELHSLLHWLTAGTLGKTVRSGRTTEGLRHLKRRVDVFRLVGSDADALIVNNVWYGRIVCGRCLDSILERCNDTAVRIQLTRMLEDCRVCKGCAGKSFIPTGGKTSSGSSATRDGQFKYYMVRRTRDGILGIHQLRIEAANSQSRTRVAFLNRTKQGRERVIQLSRRCPSTTVLQVLIK